MPRPHAYNPLLKSYPDSEKINKVSEGAETLYTRLLAICDDNACFWGDPKLVLVKAYSQRWASGQLMFEDVADRLEELRAVELIRFYHHRDKAYLQVLNCFKTLRRDVKRICLFPEPPAPATAVHIQEAAEGQEEPQEGTEALFQTDQGGNGSGPDAGRTRPGPGPDTAWQKRPDQTRPEGEQNIAPLVAHLIRWKVRDGYEGKIPNRELDKMWKLKSEIESELDPPPPGPLTLDARLAGACRYLLEQENSPRWTNIDYALGCIRSKVRELIEGATNGRIKRKPDEIRDDHRRQQAANEQLIRQAYEKNLIQKRSAISIWILNTPEEDLERLRQLAMIRNQHLSDGLLRSGNYHESGLLRELMYDIAHEPETQEAKP